MGRKRRTDFITGLTSCHRIFYQNTSESLKRERDYES